MRFTKHWFDNDFHIIVSALEVNYIQIYKCLLLNIDLLVTQEIYDIYNIGN